jgi:hypothetical protein
MNGVYVDAESGAITYLSQNLSEFLSAYLSEEERKTILFIAGRRGDRGPSSGTVSVLPGDRSGGESVFAESCARFIYYFFTGEKGGLDSPVYFLADRVPGFPSPLSDLVWDAMHGKPAALEALLRTCGLPPLEPAACPEGKAFVKVPLRKRKGYLDLRHALGALLTSKWKLILLILLIGGVLAYVFVDFGAKKGSTNYTSGLAPRGVIELYYTAMNRLDLDVLQSLFFRRAGREVLNEMSTLYVMSKLSQIYGGRYRPAEGGEPSSILSVEDLHIEQVSDGEKPVFHARYKKMINTGEKRTEYLINEIVSLGRVKDRWTILSVQSRTVE